MKKVVSLGLILVCGLTLAACGDSGSTDSSVSAEPAKSAKNTKDSSITETSEVTENSSVEEQADNDLKSSPTKYSTDWTDDWNGLKFSIPEISFAKTSDQDREDMMTEGEAIMGVKFVFENTSEHDFDTYPDQATAVVNGQQIEAEMLASEHIGGEILSGVKKEGLVVFDIPELEDPASVKEVRLKWSASNHDTDDMDNMFHDFDITINLK